MLWLTNPPNFRSCEPATFEKSSFQMKRSSWFCHGAWCQRAGYPSAPQFVGRPTPGVFGKTVGNFEAMSLLSASPALFVVMKILFPARENWNSLTDVELKVVASLTAKL